MKKENLFCFILFLSIVVIRLLIFLIPNVDIKLGYLTIHHFWFGLVVFLIGLFIAIKFEKTKLLFNAFGLGLMVDQITFLIFGAGGDLEYWALHSILGTILLLLILLMFRKPIFNWLSSLDLKDYFTKK